MRANLPNKELFIGNPLPSRQDLVFTGFIASGNDAHVFRAHSKTLNRDFACKLIPRANLVGVDEDPPKWKSEIEKANSITNPAVVRFTDQQTWKDEQKKIDCIVLISDYIKGSNLRDFIKSKKNDISILFVIQFMETILELFYEMKDRKIAHSDLHTGNIIVEERMYALTESRFAFRVLDFGVANATSDARFKDDYMQLADILQQLLERVDYQTSSPQDRFIYNALNNQYLARHLCEQDPTMDNLCKNPKALFDKLRRLQDDFDNVNDQQTTKLSNPFDFLNCEAFGEASGLLNSLYSSFFLGLDEIESRNNVVVTGPRGCGKSMVFKNLSLRQRLRVDKATPESISYISIYYRCDDLYFTFPRYQLPERQEALDLPIHFIVATLLMELLISLENWAAKYFKEEFDRGEERVVSKIRSILEIAEPSQPGANSLRSLVVQLGKQRSKAAERQRFVKDLKRPIPSCFNTNSLQKACSALSDTFSFMRNRPVYFLVDDYSSPKITKPLQESLNRVFMQRTAVCFFKLSTESPVSFSKKDIDQKIYVENREYILLNLGIVYLNAQTKQKSEFIKDIFRRRLSAVEKPSAVKELVELIGTSPEQSFNEDARQLRRGNKQGLCGIENLCHLCSGDIHYVIGLVQKMVFQAGGLEILTENSVETKVLPKIQNKAIREEAGIFLKNLRSIPIYGDRIVDIVTAFGKVAYSYLKFKDSKNENGITPHQASRIEPYEQLKLSPESQKVYDELLRYSVFIEDFRGKSRRGEVVPRLYLRRFLIPHFNLSFSKRDSVELEPTDFETFLSSPREFEKRFLLKKAPSDSGAVDDLQTEFPFIQQKKGN